MARRAQFDNHITFKRSEWVTDDGLVQSWVNEIIWKVIAGPRDTIKAPPAREILIEAFEVCRQALVHNGLQAIAPLVYGEKIKEILGEEFYKTLELDKRRTDIFMQELSFLLRPILGAKVLMLGDFPMRKYYAQWGQKDQNPRLIRKLTFWTPTLGIREDVGTLLLNGGYEKGRNEDEYIFNKTTGGVRHSVLLKGMLWEATKNWSSDLEREIWDRAYQGEGGAQGRIDETDQLILALRTFAIDTLLSGGIELLDLVLMLETCEHDLDWDRLRQIKNMFLKPDWFWIPFLSLGIYQKKTGRSVSIPGWVHDGVKAYNDSFWVPFIESRLSWANPDTKLSEFSRAYVKVAKGT